MLRNRCYRNRGHSTYIRRHSKGTDTFGVKPVHLRVLFLDPEGECIKMREKDEGYEEGGLQYKYANIATILKCFVNLSRNLYPNSGGLIITHAQDTRCAEAWCRRHVETRDCGEPVTKACFYEPQVNRTYAEMAAHYGTAVVPARPRKPRDKAKSLPPRRRGWKSPCRLRRAGSSPSCAIGASSRSPRSTLPLAISWRNSTIA